MCIPVKPIRHSGQADGTKEEALARESTARAIKTQALGVVNFRCWDSWWGEEVDYGGYESREDLIGYEDRYSWMRELVEASLRAGRRSLAPECEQWDMADVEEADGSVPTL